MSSALDLETKSIIDSTLRRFVDQYYDFATRRDRLAAPVDFLRYWPMLAELGVLGLPLTEDQGGLSGHPKDIADAVSTLARGLILEPFIDSAVLASSLLASGPDSEDELNALVSGELIAVVLGGRAGAEPLKAIAKDAGYQLQGLLTVQAYAAQANLWLVVAQDEAASPLIFKLDPQASDAKVDSYRLMDDRPAADVNFVGQAVLTPWLSGAEAAAAVAQVQALAGVAMGADALGVMQSLLQVTAEYLQTRQQFGVYLASFQALQHRFADMQMAYLETRAIVNKLIDNLAQGNHAQISGLARAVLSVLRRTGARLGHEAIQMHGGMGATDELVISHYNNRLVVLVRQLEQWLDGQAVLVGDAKHPSVLDDGFDEAAFREQIRNFIEDNLDPQTRHKVRNGLYLEKHDYVNWQKALNRQGWFGAAWPKEFGGQDWSVRQEHIFLQECAIHAAPMLIPYGVNMLGPVLHAFGTERQRELYLPGILTSDTWWCQGYSEPNAGSDLASLNTGAVRDGDFYVVNGTKMWTTEAHWADMMHCLVRTDRSGRKQQGISFLLIDMNTPGITVEPIVTLDGVHHTNQVFFDNVRVPVENLVGEEGDGWKIAKYLLARERGFIADTGNKLRMMAQIKQSFTEFAPKQLVARALLAEKLFDIEAALTALVALEHDYIEGWMRGEDDGIGASVLKVRGTEVLQLMTEYWRDLLGAYGACYDASLRKSGDGLSATLPWVQAASVNYAYLYGRCWSIFGGTNEVQRNIIAATVLRG